jgi:GNAT superfamily N-acetyltransferase
MGGKTMIKFEKATALDAQALTEVQTRCFDDDSRRFAGQPGGGPDGYDSVGWQVQMMQRAIYYKILDDKQIIGGFIVFNVGGGVYHLGRIYLAPEFQDRGIGGQAMTFIEKLFPAAKRWTLDTPSWAVRNHYFYEKHGYAKAGEQPLGPDMVLFLYEKVIYSPKS